MLGRLLSILLSLAVAGKLLIYYLQPVSDTHILWEMLLVVLGIFFMQRHAVQQKPQEEAPYFIKEGLKIGVTFAFFNAVLAWFMYTFIIPGYLNIRLESRVAEAMDSQWTSEQLEQWRANAEILFSPMIYGSIMLLTFLFFSFFIAIITGLIFRFVPLFRKF